LRDQHPLGVNERFLDLDGPGVLIEDDQRRVAWRHITGERGDVLWGKESRQIARRRGECALNVVWHVGQFHRHGGARLIFHDEDEIDEPDDPLLARLVDGGRDLAFELIAWKADNKIIEWSKCHLTAPLSGGGRVRSPLLDSLRSSINVPWSAVRPSIE
jgi:hypothetical protein